MGERFRSRGWLIRGWMRMAAGMFVVGAGAFWVLTTFGGVATGRIVPGAARAAVASCRIAQTANVRRQAGLVGVSVTSARNAWAVGDFWSRGGPATLIERWNGKAWKVQASPNPRGAGDDQLAAVAATSTTNAWAVGNSGPGGTLIEHWNGKAWKIRASPKLQGDILSGVAATSRTNAWAVGSTGSGGLIEHWNGRAWKLQPSPNNINELFGVAASSSTNAWLVGEYVPSDFRSSATVAVHCG
jgi:hypothetical protein